MSGILANLLYGTAPGALSNFLPPKDAQGAEKLALGAGTGAYSGIDGVLQMAASVARNALPYIANPTLSAILPDVAERSSVGIRNAVPQPGHLPGAEAAAALHERSIERAEELVPKVFPAALVPQDPQTRGEEMARNAGVNIGTMAFPGALTKLPGWAGQVAKIIPTLKELPITAPLAAAFSGGSDIVTNYKQGIGPGDKPLNADPHASRNPETVAAPDAKPLSSGAGDLGFSAVPYTPVTQLSTDKKTEPIDTTKATPYTPQMDEPTTGGNSSLIPDFSKVSGATGLSTGWLAAGAAALAAAGAVGMRGHGVSAYRGALELLDGIRTPKAPVADPIAAPGTPATGAAPAPGSPAATAGATRAPGTPLLTGPPKDVQLPKGVDTPVKQGMFDANAVIDNLYDTVAQTPDMARSFRAMTGTANDMSKMNRLEHQANTGVSYLTGQNITPLRDLTRAIRGMDDTNKAAFHEYMNIKDELQNRYVNMLEEIKNKKITDDNAITDPYTNPGRRVGFIEKSDVDLRNRIAEIERNHPQAEAAADLYRRVTHDILNELEYTGLRTPQEVALMRKLRDWYVPTVDAEGKITHPLGPRDTTPGSRASYINSDPTASLAQHYDALYSAMHDNMITRNLIEDTLAKQRRDPNFPKLFTETRVPVENTRNVTFRDATGRARHVQVNNGILKNAMHNNPVQLGMIGNAFATSRRIVQSGSTGPLALLGGKFFPIVDAARNFMLIPVTQQKGMVSGLMDAKSQQRFGVSSRAIPDPTRIAGTLHAGTADLGSMFAGRLAEALHPQSGDKMAGHLRTLLGNQFVDAAHARLQGIYDSSSFAEQRALGLRGAGAHGSTDIPSYQNTGGSQPTMRTSMAAIDPSLFRSRLAGQAMDFRGIVHDVFNAISGSPLSHYYRINKKFNIANRSPEELAHMVRSVVGDPGVAGASTFAKTAAATIPYGNVSVQGMRAIAHAYKTNGRVATLAALSSSVMLPALASLYTAMRSGPDAVNHLENEVSTRQRASDVILYRGEGEAPESAVRLSLPQEMRIPYALSLEIMAKALGAFQHHEGDPMHSRIFHVLEDVFQHRISNTTLQSVLHAGQDTFGFSPPPALNAVANLTGKNVDSVIPIDTIVNNIRDGKPWLSGYARDLIPKGGSPNEAHDSTVTANDGNVFRAIISNLTGVSSKAWDNVASGIRDYKEYGSIGHAIGAVAEQYSQGIRDQTPMLNSVWKQSSKLSTADPLEEHVNAQMAALRPLVGGATDIKAEGLTRPKGVQIDTGDDTKVPGLDRPEMRQMYILAGRVGGSIERRFGPMITDMRKQIADAQKKNDYYADDQRSLVNVHTRQLHEQYVKVAERINELNAALSRIAGRHVDVRRIDWSKNLDQFD